MSGKTTPDVQFIHGITSLMISSSCGHTDIVEALIQSGANVNKTDEFGDTALDYAEVAKQDTTRILLLKYDGLCGIDLVSKVRYPEESLHKTVDSILTEKKTFLMYNHLVVQEGNKVSIFHQLRDILKNHLTLILSNISRLVTKKIL